MEDYDLQRYIYWEYSVAVLLITEVLRALFGNVNTPFVRRIMKEQPKWLTLIVAVALAAADWILLSHSFHLWQFTISFGLAVLGYDYGLKILKERIVMPFLDWIKTLKQ